MITTTRTEALAAPAVAPSKGTWLPGLARATFAPIFLATGASLVIYIVSGFSLLGATAISIASVAGFGRWRWLQLSPDERTTLARTLKVGLISGALATAAYDGFRYLIIEVLAISFWPFDIFTHFGRGLVGADAPAALVTAAGVLFHIANGVGFATAYTVAFGRSGWVAGIAWAMCLEVMMVSFYPGWLNMKALDEFLQVSVFGHFVYGSTLGYTSRRLLTR
ncbi:MAG TPA: hypothetical protein VFN74_24840 [Chloroflexota bacterium]|nr:hypothetical protein [Chloroflexota bacterium]